MIVLEMYKDALNKYETDYFNASRQNKRLVIIFIL